MIPCCIMAIEDESDREFMTALYVNYKNLMYATIREIVGGREDTEDVLQDVLEKLIDKISLLRSRERDRMVNYIISACKFTAYNYIRNRERKREAPLEEYEAPPDAEGGSHEIELRMIRGEELEALGRVLPRLDERTRCLLEGYYFLEKPIGELGRDLGIKPDSVRMYLTRARQRAFALLREEIKTEIAGAP